MKSPFALPGWSVDQLEHRPSEVLDRRGMLVYRSEAQARLIDAMPFSMGTPRRKLQFTLDPPLHRAIENWLAFVISGSLARLRITSGNIDLPRRTGGTIACRWQYFAIPEGDPDYHLLFFSAPEKSTPRTDASDALDASMLGRLTLRECQVLQELLEGHSPEEIGNRLEVSVNTVRVHTRSIYVKLQVNSRPQLMAQLAHAPDALTRLGRSTRGIMPGGPKSGRADS